MVDSRFPILSNHIRRPLRSISQACWLSPRLEIRSKDEAQDTGKVPGPSWASFYGVLLWIAVKAVVLQIIFWPRYVVNETASSPQYVVLKEFLQHNPGTCLVCYRRRSG
jgi:hypothetical protein